MGIYVQSFADLPANAPGGTWPSRIAASAREWANERDLSELFYTSTHEKGGMLTIHPAGGHLRFEIDGPRVSIDAKTSVCGPGFHAALIDLTDHLERTLGTHWRWDAGGDETGFATHRNRQELAKSFANQFAAYCDLYRRRRDSDDAFILNLPTDIAFGKHSGVATPMGPLPIDFFIYDDPSEDEVRARAIFPWWSDVLDQKFWQNTLKALLWSEVEWRAPRGPWEEFVARATLYASKRAPLDQEVGLDVAELARLQHATEFNPPRTDGVGWRRQPRGYYLPGPWRLTMPGYYIDQIEDNGSTTCVWFGDEEVRGSSITTTTKTPGEIGWSERFSDAHEYDAPRFKFRLEPEAKPSAGNPGFGIIFAECQAFDEHGQAAHILTLSLFAPLSDELPRRFEEIVRSVFFDPPQPLPTTPRDA